MAGRLPREMLASIVRRLSVTVGTGEIVEALNFANQHLASYYSWPWFLSEMTWTFRAPVTGTATVTSAGTVTLTDPSDPNFADYVDRNWRIQIGTYDYPVDEIIGDTITVDSTKVRPIAVTTATNFVLFHAGLTMPPDFQPGRDIACYNTTMRYRVRHVNRMAFERHWQSYKQMTSNIPLLFSDREPFYDSGAKAWRYQLQFCPRPASGTQVRISYYRRPSVVDLTTNAPMEWPEGFDEVLELVAAGRLAEANGDQKAMLGARRAKGLIRQLRGSVATAVMDETPMQNAPFGGAAWEEDGLSVLPREV